MLSEREGIDAQRYHLRIARRVRLRCPSAPQGLRCHPTHERDRELLWLLG